MVPKTVFVTVPERGRSPVDTNKKIVCVAVVE